MAKSKKKPADVVQATINIGEKFAIANENYNLGFRAGAKWAMETLRDEHKDYDYIQSVLDRTKTARMCP